MDYAKEQSKSVYDYADKSVKHAGYAAVVYAVISLVSGALAWIQYFIYHRPATGGFSTQEFTSQQYLQHTPLITAVAIAFGIMISVIAGVLAFFIFRQSRFAIVAMIVFVLVLQLYAWIAARSPAGTLLSIVVAAFLLRGARRIFQDHAERRMEAEKVSR